MRTRLRLLPVLTALFTGCTAADPPTCEGGGAPLLELGDGGRTDFEAFADGVALPTTGSPAGVNLEMQTSGIDTTQGVSVVVRVAADGGPSEDNLAVLSFQCASAADGTGFGWANAIATIPADATPGSALTIDAVATDWRGITATTTLSAVVE